MIYIEFPQSQVTFQKMKHMNLYQHLHYVNTLLKDSYTEIQKSTFKTSPLYLKRRVKPGDRPNSVHSIFMSSAMETFESIFNGNQ